MLKTYFNDLFSTTKAGDVREESYYPDLKKLLEVYAKYFGKSYFVTSLPRKTEAGNPDFRILTSKKQLVGYIEAKAPTVDNLETVEDSEQLERYRSTFPNLILTNFFEFRLYRDGELVDKVLTGRPFVIHKLQMVPPAENEVKFTALLEKFFAFSTPRTTSAKQLALELAKRTRFLRDNVIAEELKEESIEGTQTLEAFYKAFKDHLITSLTPADFANLFAQTITYGLFAARSRAENGFNREVAYKYIPHTVGILRDVFRFISSTDLPKSLEWIVDDISEVLANTDVKKIITDFYKGGRGHDPIIHFYETFLAEYDPKEREKRGVYYTPESVVGYIVRSIHKLLKDKLGKSDGFAHQSVTVLDPAAGTLTFPAEAIHQAVSEYKSKYGDGGIHGLVRDHILKNFYAFELMMASYAVGHLKIGFIFDEIGYKLADDERFNLYLTNTLDFSKTDPNQFPGFFEQTIAKESQEALRVKEEVPIMVVMGNPPYSGQSENKGEWILKQIDEYKKVNGEPLGEKNPKWLQDDYVKFIRFAQWKIEQTGSGVLGFITNHAWLDNPTFRGMRSSILNTFDEIYILNLHGSLFKKETTPKGSKDENVFDIQPGVAITLAIKSKNLKEKKVFYADIWGLREEKYNWLDKNNLTTTSWQVINPNDPHYFMVAKDEKNLAHYQTFIKITDIFPVNSVGIVTGRDEFVIGFDKQALEIRIRIFADTRESDDFIKSAYNLIDKPASNWSVAKARAKLRNDPNWEKNFVRVLYRPFDERWIFYNATVIERGRENVMNHLLQPNLAMMTCRQITGDTFQHIFVTNQIVDDCMVSNRTRERGYVLPLYRYHSSLSPRLWDSQDKQGIIDSGPIKEVNIDPKLFASLETQFKNGLATEEVFYYIYAILYSNSYRQNYQEFLKTDFPRIPFTKDYQLFKRLAKLGEWLVDFHLLKSKELDEPIIKLQGSGDNRVNKREYFKFSKPKVQTGIHIPTNFQKTGLVMINDSQCFAGIDPEVWNYYIGGYQVLDKWLKNRIGRTLSSEDIKHYCKMATALAKTIAIQKQIDGLYLEVEETLL